MKITLPKDNMRKYNIYWILAFLVTSCIHNKKFSVSSRSVEKPFWSDKRSDTFNLNRQDSTKWDLKMLSNDLKAINPSSDFPFNTSPFPTPDYDLMGKGSFKGLGNFSYSGGKDNELILGNKTILFNSFYVKKSVVNENYIGSNKDEVFFEIILLTDFIDTINYAHLSSEVISRNHPHYIGQGFYKTKSIQIDYCSFITANRNAYAIINTRLFDLTQGRIILVAPQKNGSIRTVQLKSPLLSSDSIEEYTKKLLTNDAIIAFFTYPGNI